jgi:hypothetical protein
MRTAGRNGPSKRPRDDSVSGGGRAGALKDAGWAVLLTQGTILGYTSPCLDRHRGQGMRQRPDVPYASPKGGF